MADTANDHLPSGECRAAFDPEAGCSCWPETTAIVRGRGSAFYPFTWLCEECHRRGRQGAFSSGRARTKAAVERAIAQHTAAFHAPADDSGGKGVTP